MLYGISFLCFVCSCRIYQQIQLNAQSAYCYNYIVQSVNALTVWPVRQTEVGLRLSNDFFLFSLELFHVFFILQLSLNIK